MAQAIIYIIIFIAFFGGSIVGYNLAPAMLTLLIELLIYPLFLIGLILKKKTLILPLILYIFFIIIIGISSAVVNNSFNISAINGMRLTIRYYVFFLAIANLNFTDKEILRINRFIIFCFVIQIPVATVKLFIYGQGEKAIGTYSLSEGSLSTIIPLIAIGYIVAFYLYYKKHYLYILLAFGYVYYSIICAKRSLFVFLPILILFMGITFFKERQLEALQFKRLKRTLIWGAFVFIVIISIFSLKYVPALNPGRSLGGSVDLSYITDYLWDYVSKDEVAEATGYTTRRFSTTKQVISVLSTNGFEKFFFGYGPGAYTQNPFSSTKYDRELLKDIHITYGVTPFTYIAMEYGMLGVVAYFLFLISLLRMCLKYWRMEDREYWKAFSFGSAGFSFSMIVFWAIYHPPSFLGDTIPCVFFYCMAIVVTNLEKIYKNTSV